ncbi:hypothetical protein EBQ81_04185, partial [bacterium]|nr:hypothetical protein [bacterium]
ALAGGSIIAVAIVAILGFLSVNAFKAVGVGTGQSIRFTAAPFLHFLLVFVLLPAALVTLAIFATLIIRQGIILILIVTAPIAFALFALPSTEKYFTKWRETFVATLLVYPIIAVIFATSIIMAALSYNVGDSDSLPLFSSIIGAIVSLIIMFVPLVLIPFSFKIAGGILGNIMNTSKGLTSRLTSSPQNKYKENKALERKALYDEKMRDSSSFTNRKIAAKGTGRRIAASKRSRWLGGAGNSSGPQDEVDAYAEASEAATTGGATPSQADEAGAAARNSYRGHKRRLADPSGNLSPVDRAASAAGGRVAGAATAHGGYTPQQISGASDAAVSAYRQSIAAGFTHEESTAAANASAGGILAGRSQQASEVAGRVAANTYRQQASGFATGKSTPATAHAAASASAQSAANVYDESLRRTSDPAQSSTAAETAGNAANLAFDSTRTTHSMEAATTAALATGDAYIGSTHPPGTSGHVASLNNAALAAADAHDNAMRTGAATNHTQATIAGRQAGQSHW